MLRQYNLSLIKHLPSTSEIVEVTKISCSSSFFGTTLLVAFSYHNLSEGLLYTLYNAKSLIKLVIMKSSLHTIQCKVTYKTSNNEVSDSYVCSFNVKQVLQCLTSIKQQQ